jgi:hypothetical protein
VLGDIDQDLVYIYILKSKIIWGCYTGSRQDRAMGGEWLGRVVAGRGLNRAVVNHS